MKTKTVEAARGRWSEIMLQLGLDERYLSGKHSGCPLCGQGKDTFRFDDKNGSGSYFCGKCGSGYGVNFVMKWLDQPFKDAAKRIDEILGNLEFKPVEPKWEKDPRPLLRLIAQGAKPLTGEDPASIYLRNRGLSVTSPELRWHPALTYWDRDDSGNPVKRGKYPAMVVPVCDENGTSISYHVTYLAKGQKANVPSPKKVMTPIKSITGGAIRLFPAAKSLVVAEGVETALAFNEAFNIPVWATITAHGMETLKLPEEVRELTIVADNDKSFAGQKAAYILANRMALEGRYVEVILEGTAGQDYLDIFNQRGKVA